MHGSVILSTGHGSVKPPISAWISLSRRDHAGTTTASFRAFRIKVCCTKKLGKQCNAYYSVSIYLSIYLSACPADGCEYQGAVTRTLHHFRQRHAPGETSREFVAVHDLHPCPYCRQWFHRLLRHTHGCKISHSSSPNEIQKGSPFPWIPAPMICVKVSVVVKSVLLCLYHLL